MRKFLLIFFLLTECALAKVYMVKSNNNLNPEKTKFGSGVLINKGKEHFMVTSEHVIYHKDATHYYKKNGQFFEMELLEVNWTTGIAVLKVDEIVEGVDFQDISLPQENMAVKMIGFPHNKKNDEIEEIDGMIDSLVVNDYSYLTSNNLFQINKVASRGMSGGAVFSGKSFLGMLTHIYEADSRTIAISSEKILKSLNKCSVSKCKSNAYYLNENELYIGGLKLKGKSEQFSVGLQRSGDPVGIGGQHVSLAATPSSTLNSFVSIEISLIDYENNLNGLPESFKNTVHQLKEKSLQREIIKVKYFKKGKMFYGVKNLESFGKYLGLGYEPVISLDSPFFQRRKKLERIMMNLEASYQELSGLGEHRELGLEKKVGIILKAYRSKSLELISRGYLKEVVMDQAWDRLIEEIYLSSVLDLRSHLISLDNLLKSMYLI